MSHVTLYAVTILSALFGHNSSTPKCVTGQSIACVCTDGRQGAQTCNARGAYEVCVCEVTTVKGSEASRVCDPAGTWVFSGSPTDRKCKAYPIAETIVVAG